jgi:hypothetical protein
MSSRPSWYRNFAENEVPLHVCCHLPVCRIALRPLKLSSRRSRSTHIWSAWHPKEPGATISPCRQVVAMGKWARGRRGPFISLNKVPVTDAQNITFGMSGEGKDGRSSQAAGCPSDSASACDGGFAMSKAKCDAVAHWFVQSTH